MSIFRAVVFTIWFIICVLNFLVIFRVQAFISKEHIISNYFPLKQKTSKGGIEIMLHCIPFPGLSLFPFLPHLPVPVIISIAHPAGILCFYILCFHYAPCCCNIFDLCAHCVYVPYIFMRNQWCYLFSRGIQRAEGLREAVV